jgi:hypothetical protein
VDVRTQSLDHHCHKLAVVLVEQDLGAAAVVDVFRVQKEAQQSAVCRMGCSSLAAHSADIHQFALVNLSLMHFMQNIKLPMKKISS